MKAVRGERPETELHTESGHLLRSPLHTLSTLLSIRENNSEPGPSARIGLSEVRDHPTLSSEGRGREAGRGNKQ